MHIISWFMISPVGVSIAALITAIKISHFSNLINVRSDSFLNKFIIIKISGSWNNILNPNKYLVIKDKYESVVIK